MADNLNTEMIKKSIQFYKSRGFSEDEMISDISETLHISKDIIIKILNDMKK